MQSNIDRLMRRSKVAEKKEWKTVRVNLWEKVNGELVLVDTVAPVFRNATKYMLRGVKGRDYVACGPQILHRV